MKRISNLASMLVGLLFSLNAHCDIGSNSDKGVHEIVFSDIREGWINTGIIADRDETIVFEAKGRLEAEGLSVPASFVIWYRVGNEGVAKNIAADRFSFVSEERGDLYVTARPAHFYWQDDRGTYPPELKSLPATDTGLKLLIRPNASEIIASQKPPEGFHYLHVLGQSQVWSDAGTGDEYVIIGEPNDETGIIKADLDIPITRDTVFSFEWNYERLPAAMAETAIPGHDYFSIALEFENGQDLTWMRSQFLEAGTHFRCPLPWWDERETHFVIEDANTELGTWQRHERNVLDDYATAVPGELPSKIVGIWFIGANLLAKLPGKASFRDAKILQGDQEVSLLPAVISTAAIQRSHSH